MEPYFVWKGIDSRNMGIWVQKYPSIDRPPMRFNSIQIPGRPGALTLLEGEDIYESYPREIQIMPKPGADLHGIIRWLTGTGEVVFGCEPWRAQQARIFDQVQFAREFADQRSATVRFLCDPFKSDSRMQHEQIPDDLTAGTFTFSNYGDVVAYPKIALSGVGTVTVSVNGTDLALSDLQAGADIIIDSETREAYSETTDPETGITTVAPVVTHGDYAVLTPTGSTTVTWTEGVTALTVYPRWRWL